MNEQFSTKELELRIRHEQGMITAYKNVEGDLGRRIQQAFNKKKAYETELEKREGLKHF